MPSSKLFDRGMLLRAGWSCLCWLHTDPFSQPGKARSATSPSFLSLTYFRNKFYMWSHWTPWPGLCLVKMWLMGLNFCHGIKSSKCSLCLSPDTCNAQTYLHCLILWLLTMQFPNLFLIHTRKISEFTIWRKPSNFPPRKKMWKTETKCFRFSSIYWHDKHASEMLHGHFF